MNNTNLNKANKIKFIVTILLTFLTALGGISFAYFSLSITGNEEASSVGLNTAFLRLIYTDNLTISGSEIRPGWSQTKTLSVQNTGTETSYYKLVWKELFNEIINDELTISITCVSSSGTCPTINETAIPTYLSQTSNVDIKDRISIEPNVTHTYTITITFKEMSSRQNYNLGKTFYGTFNIVEDQPAFKLTGSTYEGLPIVRSTTITSEEFYDITNAVNYSSLISTNGNIYNYDSNKTVLLAKYSLYVGQICTSATSCTLISASVSGYGLQSEDAGYESSYPRNAVVPFSGSITNYGYWDPNNNGIDSKYGTYTGQANNIYDTYKITAPNYSVAFKNDAGNVNYSIAYYVKEYIETLGIDGTGRLLTYPEARAMTQVQITNGQYYWLGSAHNDSYVRYVNSDGNLYADRFYYVYFFGVRPVIVVNTSDIG